MSIDWQDGECYFYGSEVVSSLLVAAYLLEVACLLQAKGYRHATILLDRNSTHQGRMRERFWALHQQQELSIEVEFLYYAAYSPWLNVVEYGIHLVRQSQLHHSASEQSLAAVKQRLVGYFEQERPLSGEQIVNLMCHIEKQLKSKQKKANLPT